jgi:hypothetical protein
MIRIQIGDRVHYADSREENPCRAATVTAVTEKTADRDKPDPILHLLVHTPFESFRAMYTVRGTVGQGNTWHRPGRECT